MMLQAWGSELADTTVARRLDSNSRVRASVRSGAPGDPGFLFVNNYERLLELGDVPNVEVQINGIAAFPPFNITKGNWFVWPFSLGPLKWATAQLLTKVEGAWMFSRTKGVEASMQWSADVDVITLNASSRIDPVQRVTFADGTAVYIILLDDDALFWVPIVNGCRLAVYAPGASMVYADGLDIVVRGEVDEIFVGEE